MTKPLLPLLAAALASTLLVAGCGTSPAGVSGVRQAIAPTAARAAEAELGTHLVVTRATAEIRETQGQRDTQVFEVEGRLDGKPFAFSASTFFPYYIPMLADPKLNGKAVKLTPKTAKALLELFKAAEADDEARQALHNLNYGLEFRSWDRKAK